MKHLARHVPGCNLPLKSLKLFYIQVWYLLIIVILERFKYQYVIEALIYKLGKYIRIFTILILVSISSSCDAFFISLITFAFVIWLKVNTRPFLIFFYCQDTGMFTIFKYSSSGRISDILDYWDVQNSRVTKLSYETELGKVTSDFDILTQKFISKLLFQFTNSNSWNIKLTFESLAQRFNFSFSAFFTNSKSKNTKLLFNLLTQKKKKKKLLRVTNFKVKVFFAPLSSY